MGRKEQSKMLEKDMIQSRGFHNVVVNGKATGFQVQIRTQYYRGIWASLLEGAEVTVDGEKFSRDKVTWTLGGKTYTVAELEKTTDVRWPYEEADVLTVPQPGGLAVGLHKIEVTMLFRASYIPERLQPWPLRSERTITLVH
jgi:hypothetical protein